MIIVIGSKGLLGSCLTEKLKRAGYEVFPADLPEFDIISYKSLEKLPTPSIVINCAAYTDVPKAEIEKSLAYTLNADSLVNIFQFVLKTNSKLIHFSTDFVFDGYSNTPYTEDSYPNPLSTYGKSKIMGEKILARTLSDQFVIFRLQWLFGRSDKTFFSKILSKYKKEGQISLVSDEWGSPCSVDFVSNTIIKFIAHSIFTGETYHLTHNDFCSRFECGQYFLNKLGFFEGISPISNVPTLVARPKYGVLDNTKLTNLLGSSLESWKKDVDTYA